MKFSLTGYIQTNKKVDVDLKEFVDYANKELLKKGVPKGKEGAEITHCNVEGDKIHLAIKGTTYLRPHDALVRFRNYLTEQLGKKYKIGMRQLFADEYKVEFETAEEPLKTPKIPLADKVSFEGKNCTIIFKNLDEEKLQKNYLDRIMNLVDDKIKNQRYAGKGEFKEYVWNGREKPVVYRGDPAEDMEKMHWIKHTSSKGQWVLGREFTALYNVMKELVIKHVYEPLGFTEMIFPKFELWSVPRRSGHAANVYPNAYFVMTPKQSSDEFWEDVSDYYKITGEIDKKGVMERVDSVGILSYAQCPPFWDFVEGTTLDETTLPLKVYDWSGPTYRNEAGGTHGLDRIEEFHRTETLWVGTKGHEIELWKKLADAYQTFFDTILDLEIKTARVAPWWMAHAGLAAEKGTLEVGTFDFDAYLPYRGDRKTEWLEIQNVSSNGQKYPKAFNVKGRKEELWSGCAGGSFERWIAAFLAQKGFDTKNWPNEVRERFEARMKAIKPLKFL
jgi:seryl-tRNA synthetase